jgi:hypothetical protein
LFITNCAVCWFKYSIFNTAFNKGSNKIGQDY